MAENTQVDVSRLTFERAIEELESIVKRLEDGKVPLEESVTIYERGEALKRRQQLTNAPHRLQHHAQRERRVARLEVEVGTEAAMRGAYVDASAVLAARRPVVHEAAKADFADALRHVESDGEGHVARKNVSQLNAEDKGLRIGL